MQTSPAYCAAMVVMEWVDCFAESVFISILATVSWAYDGCQSKGSREVSGEKGLGESHWLSYQLMQQQKQSTPLPLVD